MISVSKIITFISLHLHIMQFQAYTQSQIFYKYKFLFHFCLFFFKQEINEYEFFNFFEKLLEVLFFWTAAEEKIHGSSKKLNFTG